MITALQIYTVNSTRHNEKPSLARPQQLLLYARTDTEDTQRRHEPCKLYMGVAYVVLYNQVHQ